MYDPRLISIYLAVLRKKISRSLSFLPINNIIIEYNPKHDTSHVKSVFVSHSIPSAAVVAHRPQMPWLCFAKKEFDLKIAVFQL